MILSRMKSPLTDARRTVWLSGVADRQETQARSKTDWFASSENIACQMYGINAGMRDTFESVAREPDGDTKNKFTELASAPSLQSNRRN